MWTTFSACERDFRGPDGRADEVATSGGLPQNSTAGPTGTMSRSRAPKPRRAGIDLGPGTRTKNPLGAWLDDQSADSIPPLLRAIVAHQSAGLLWRTSHRGNSRSRRRRSSQSWRLSGRSRGRTGAAGLAGDVSSCSRSDAYFFLGCPAAAPPRASSSRQRSRGRSRRSRSSNHRGAGDFHHPGLLASRLFGPLG